MKKIIFFIPKDNKEWKCSYITGIMKKKDLSIILKRIEKRLLASHLKEKMVIVIKDGSLVINKSCPSTNPKYLCWLMYAFLEDYISRDYYLSKEKLFVRQEP